MIPKRVLSLIMVICMVFSVLVTGFPSQAAEVTTEELSANAEISETAAELEVAETAANLYGLADNVQNGQILQCWTWSYNNISNNLQKIAEQGFSAIQTSPIQPIKETTSEYYNTISNSSWVVYQPVAFNIETNYMNVQGTKTEFKAMCDKAHKYGIKVIVDVVFNHMANDMSENTLHPWIPSEIKDNSDCWHDITKNIYNYDDRYETTQYCLTGLPDLNTSNSIVQQHCTNFLKEAIDAGADGFRFDAVKHIETPWDADGIKSDFWPNVLNAATAYAQETRGITPYYYGELLGSPGGGLSVEAYTQYMSVSDPGSSDSIRDGVCNSNASQAASGNISNGAAKNKTVQWTESHDNHKDNGTNMVSEHNINKTWAIIGAKDEVCGMYLARPQNMSETMMGDADETSWSYPEVKAVNRFKNAFVGQSEYLSSYNNLACVERGTSGIVIVNTGGTYYNGMSAPVYRMASGTYKDVISGNTFTVSDGYISGNIGDTGIAVVYNADSTGTFTKGNVTDFAVAGTFNDWSTSSHKLVAKDANTASVTMFIDEGTYNFKLTANDLWYGNAGTIEDTTGSGGWTMRTSVDDNCTLVASGGKYTFTFNITTGKLVIDYENTTDKTSTVYLKGTFNNWGNTNQMTYVDNTNTVTTSISLSAGTYTFKIHNSLMESWYGNAGTINDSTGTGGWTMKASVDDKCTLVATGGTYTFTYNLSTNKLVVANDEEEVVSTFTVTFVDWDGSELTKQTVEEGQSATAPEAPTREATAQYTYTFSGWDKDFSNITENTTVTALYTQTVNKYTVTFTDWDGVVLSTQQVEYGSAAEAPEDPTRDGYSFTGWGTDFSSVTNDITVTAVYKDNSTYLKGSFNDWDTTDVMVPASDENIVSVTLQLEAGTYTFKIHSEETWYGNNGTIEDTTLATSDIGWEMKTGKGNCTLNASGGTYTFNFNLSTHYLEILYSAPTYTVTFVDYDGSIIDTQTVEEGTSAIAPASPTREATAQYTYTFEKWNTDFSSITSDTVVTAVYTETVNTYSVTFKNWDGTELEVQTIEYGKDATAPEVPDRSGYTFAGWDKSFTSITEDTVVTATYTKIQTAVKTGRLKIDVTGGTGFKIAVDGGTLRPQGTMYMNTKLPIGAEVTLVANTADNFLGWMDEAGVIRSLTETFTFTSTGNDYYKAVYLAVVEGVNLVTFKFAEAANRNGQIIDMQYYAAGDEIILPDGPTRAGYNFTGWSMTAEEIKTALAAGEDVEVVALWERVKVYITVVANGGTVVTAPQSNGMYLAYASVTVKADDAPANQKFAYWVDANGKVVSYLAEYKFLPAASIELTAVYVAENVTVEKQPIVAVAGDPTVDGEKITYTVSWEVDETLGTVTNYGVVFINQNDYNEETFYHGSGDTKMFDRALSASGANVQKILTLSSNQGITYDNTYVIKAFVIYTDATTGQSVTAYSDIVVTFKPAP